jgi:hypothetical protein
VSYDESGAFRQNPGMDRMSETEEKLAFIGRVRSARMARFDTQKPMCIILGLEQDVYKQYETRTPLPYKHIPKFIAACGISYEWLMTGEGAGPMIVPLPTPRKRTRKIPRRRVA